MKKLLLSVIILILCLILFCGCAANTIAGSGNGADSSVTSLSGTESSDSLDDLEDSAPANTPDPEASEKNVVYLESMDTVISLTAYGSNRSAALDAASAEIERLNDMLSIGVDTSEISMLNSSGHLVLSDETSYIISRALEINELTGGLFDITITPLMELWGFTTKEYHVPTQEELDSALSRVGISNIDFDPDTNEITLFNNAEIDLGGIAKGYSSSRMMEILSENGVTSAIVSLGGNIHCLGLKPDGSRWKVGIRDPWGSETSIICVLQIEDEAVITSGGYERYFVDEETGKTYIHIIDPSTGIPVESDLASVSIITKDGTLGDGLSTAMYIMGLDDGIEFWREHSDLFDAIFITTDEKIYATEGIYDYVTPVSDEINLVKK